LSESFNLKTFSILFLFFLALLSNPLSAQTLPDYKERTFAVFGDTITQMIPQLTATEGSVDPDQYIIGPGDKLFISISGLEEVKTTLLVDQEGNLFIPKVGGIDLNNTTLSDARGKIASAIYRYYRNVDVFITLLDFRKIKVSLLGNVKSPSSHVLYANSRLNDLVSVSKGLTESSNYRNIKIVSNNGEIKEYDFLRFLRFGDNSNNPFLKEGDRVLIDKVDKVIRIYGEIKYPGIYEYIEGETVTEFIELAGGFTLKARSDTIEVISFEIDGMKQISNYYSYQELSDNDVRVNIQDMILVRELPEYYLDRYVRVDGYVKYPGWYKIIEDSTTLYDVIREAGGFRKDASLTEATLSRVIGTVQEDPELERLKLIPRSDMTDDEYDYLKAKSRERPGRVVVDFERLFRYNDMNENIVLQRNDKINIPEVKNYITMLGQVVNPGKIIYRKDLTVNDYIALAGGFGWRAKENEVRVIKVNTGEWIEADDVESLDPGDTIWIPEDPPGPKFWDVFTTALTVTGQIAAIVAATMAVIIATK
jgi:polysaccharide biosynthesis/export protein